MSAGLPALELSDRQISAIGVGTARLGAFWQGRSIADGRCAVETACQLGVSMLDTADVYARGIAERIIGSAAARHQDALIITKAGLLKTPAALLKTRSLGIGGGQPLSGLKPAQMAGKCFHPEYLRWAADRSSSRLKQETLDVFLLHEPDEDVLRDHAAAEALLQLRAEGRIRRWGVSVRSAREAAAAMELPEMSWLQIPAAVLESPEFDLVAGHPRRAGVVVQAMAITGPGHAMLHGGAALPQDRIAWSAKAVLDRGRADSVLIGMSSGRRVYQNVTALQRAYRDTGPVAANGVPR